VPGRSILHSPMGSVKSLPNASAETSKLMPYRISFSRKTCQHEDEDEHEHSVCHVCWWRWGQLTPVPRRRSSDSGYARLEAMACGGVWCVVCGVRCAVCGV
jgi:hypothetical protein